MRAGSTKALNAPLPWWTWIAPGIVAYLGTQFSFASHIAPGVPAISLTIPLGIVMLAWWGPRALVGVYVNAVISAAVWELPALGWQFVYPVPELVAIVLGATLFTRVARARWWLPAVADSAAFVLVAIAPAALGNGLLTIGFVIALGELPSSFFWSGAWSSVVATTLGGVAVAAPVAMLLTPWLARHGLSRTTDAAAARVVFVEHAARRVEVALVFGALAAFALIAPLGRYWSVYAAFAIWAALRHGAHVAAVANLWMVMIATLIPSLGSAVGQPAMHVQNFDAALVLTCVMALLVGRTVSDQTTILSERDAAGRALEGSEAVLRQSHHALAESEAKLRMILREQTEFIVKWRPDGTRTFVNDAYLRYFNTTEEDCIGTSFFPLVSPEFRQMLHDKIARMTPAHPESTTEHIALTPTGERRWQSWTERGLFDEHGLLVEIMSTGRDVTERRNAEEAHRELATRYRAILESSLDALIVIDSRGDVLEFNTAAESLFGYTRSEAIGKKLADLVIPESLRAAHADGLARVVANGGAKLIGKRVELPAMRADGSEVQVELAISRISGTDPPLFAGAVRDIGARLQLEDQLRQSQKMDAIGQLAGGVAHDFNNLLTVINGYADLMRDSLPPEHPMAGPVREIYDAGQRSAALTRQLLTFSRRQVVSPQVLDVNALIGDLDRMLRRMIGEDVELSLACSPALGRVRADPGQVEQVLLNLAVNARDAMPRGGKLTIETRMVEVDEEFVRTHVNVAPGSYVLIAVSDTGVGMQPDVRARIFEPFFTTKEAGRGTGLGLSVVHGIVRQSSGIIDVYSEPGQGTTMKVYLPVAWQGARRNAVDVADHVPHGTETILLVEDEEAVRRLTSRMLTTCGYRVLEAANGDEALSIASRESAIDLLLTDVVMPGMSGSIVAKRFVDVHPNAKVLFASGYTGDTVIRHGILDEQVAFLAKPFSLSALAKKVREVVEASGDQRNGDRHP